MAKLLVLYYSQHGHVEALAHAIAEGAREAGATADLRRVPDAGSQGATGQAPHAAHTTPTPTATVEQEARVDDLRHYDAIVVGSPTRYGRICGPMASFLDRTGKLWSEGALVGKVGSAFTSTATQHGGQETTLFSLITNLLHLGLIVVGLPYSFAGQMRLDEITGGSPYGVTTIAGGDARRRPSANELEAARFQGRHVAEIAARLSRPGS